MRFVPVLLVALACGNNPDCDTAIVSFCTLQVTCGREPSVAECQKTFDEDYVCNASRDQGLRNCSEKLQEYNEAIPPRCENAFPLECSDILCSRVGGCDNYTPQGYCEVPLESGAVTYSATP